MHIEAVNMTHTLFGWIVFSIFVVGYFFIAAEEKYHINKAKPALFAGTFIFILIAIYYVVHGLDMNLVHIQAQHLILEIAEIFFFLFVGTSILFYIL